MSKHNYSPHISVDDVGVHNENVSKIEIEFHGTGSEPKVMIHYCEDSKPVLGRLIMVKYFDARMHFHVRTTTRGEYLLAQIKSIDDKIATENEALLDEKKRCESELRLISRY